MNLLTTKNCYKTFRKKPKKLQNLINDALTILVEFGLSFDDKSPRLKEKTALAFLSLGCMTVNSKWNKLQDIENHTQTSREIITYQNKKFNENRSSGSYDDVRREDLKELVLANIVLNTKPKSAKNDPTRSYGLSSEYVAVAKEFGNIKWTKMLRGIVKKRGKFRDRTSIKRKFKKIEIKTPDGKKIKFSIGEHNDLQKAIVEEFIPRFCPGGQLAYLGDTENKSKIKDEKLFKSLNFLKLEHGMLPDVVVYLKKNNWLFLIEAVHTANPMTKTRKIELEDLLKNCKAEIIYVSAFANRTKFREWVSKIAWETEIWIADESDHLIHFNGNKFLGPYKKQSKN